MKFLMHKILLVVFSLGLLAVYGSPVPATAAAVITVTTAADAIQADGACSLREAVIAANSDATFNDCPAGSGADVIQFDAQFTDLGLVRLTRVGEDEDGALTGDLDITSDVTILGAGADRTHIDGDKAIRVFHVLPGGKLTLTGLAVQNGKFEANSVGGGIFVEGLFTTNNVHILDSIGGGVVNAGGSVRLIDSTVSGTTGGYGIHNSKSATLEIQGGLIANNGFGGIYNEMSTTRILNALVQGNAGAGGVYNTGVVTTRMTVTGSRITGNTSNGSGGGVYNSGSGARTDIENSRIDHNSASSAGGGINNNGLMTLSTSTVDQNTATSGAGINQMGGTLSITNSTISGNQATDNGGGLYNRQSTTVLNTTFANNLASGAGSGGNIFNDGAQIHFTLTLLTNIDGQDNCANSEGLILSAGNNLENKDTCGFATPGDLRNTQALLGALQDNGGDTPTHALAANSPAVDASDSLNCAKVDQRYFARPVDGNGDGAALCDIGAFELAAQMQLNHTAYLPLVSR